MKTRLLLLFIFLTTCLNTFADTQTFEVWGPAGEGAGIEIKAGGATFAASFPEGTTTEEMAQALVDGIDGWEGFTAYRVGNKITIIHSSKIVIEKVNISNTRINAASYNNGQAQIARNNMFHFNGTAAGDGQILFSNDDLVVTLNTFAGQTAMQVIDALTDALHEIVPDDGLYSFGMEFSSASFQDPPAPIGSVDLGIWALGNRNLLLTECTSTDTGIMVTQDPVGTATIPTLSQWAVIILMLLTLTVGTLFIMRKKTLPGLVSQTR